MGKKSISVIVPLVLSGFEKTQLFIAIGLKDL